MVAYLRIYCLFFQSLFIKTNQLYEFICKKAYG